MLVEAIIQDLEGKLDLLDTEIAIDQEEDVAIVPTLVGVQLSLRETVRLAEGALRLI